MTHQNPMYPFSDGRGDTVPRFTETVRQPPGPADSDLVGDELARPTSVPPPAEPGTRDVK